MNENEIRQKISQLISDFFKIKKEEFIPGKTKIQYAGSVHDENEINAIINTLLDGWFGLGKKTEEFEYIFSQFIGTKKSILVNSGSSANLLSISALCSHQFKDRIKPGDEVVTPALTFPTTLNPIIQNNLRPVLVDVDIKTYNLNPQYLQDAITEKTKLIVLPHTLGIPNEMDIIMDLIEDKNIFLIEDCCDALGSKYGNKLLGTFGIFSTFSFYPAHQMTLGEGGCITTNDLTLDRIARSLRDWGRDCYCSWNSSYTGKCGSRFNIKIDGIPYDHRYVYSNIGYNLKPLDLQAAMGIEQIKKLKDFIESRKKNYQLLYEELKIFDQFFIFPEISKKSDPCWFSFPITIKNGAPFSREEIIQFLESNGIQTRHIFAGNITRQPAYKNINFKITNELTNSDKIMKDSFFIGVYPAITEEMISYIVFKFKEFITKCKR